MEDKKLFINEIEVRKEIGELLNTSRWHFAKNMKAAGIHWHNKAMKLKEQYHIDTIPGIDNIQEGFIYVMWCAIQGSSIKVGKTTRSPIERAMELRIEYGQEFKVVFSKMSGNINADEMEVHRQLRKFKINFKNEYFKVPEDTAIQIVDEIVNSDWIEQKIQYEKIIQEEKFSENKKVLYENQINQIVKLKSILSSGTDWKIIISGALLFSIWGCFVIWIIAYMLLNMEISFFKGYIISSILIALFLYKKDRNRLVSIKEELKVLKDQDQN